MHCQVNEASYTGSLHLLTQQTVLFISFFFAIFLQHLTIAPGTGKKVVNS